MKLTNGEDCLMNQVLKGLKPEKVFEYFEILTSIPRCSGEEKAVSDYLVAFAKERQLEVIQEPCYNVIIKKPATKGYESAKSVILQGHMDMVCVKSEDSNHNFQCDPIPIYVDGDFVKTKGTTLGADNGIAVAMGLAILDADDIPHPELSLLVTVAEETGLDGAALLSPDSVSGDILINIDSEEEGELLASCAGGARNVIHLPIEWVENEFDQSAKISIRNLLGGHSGMEIIKGRGNAIKLMGRVLGAIDVPFAIQSLDGGEKMNAIAKLADCSVAVNNSDLEALKASVENIWQSIKDEFSTTDSDMTLEFFEDAKKDKVFSQKTTDSCIGILRLMPNGIQTMSADIEGLVESSNNVGVLSTTDEVAFESATRSSVGSLKEEIIDRMNVVAKAFGGEVSVHSAYPAWQYKKESYIRDLMIETYKETTGKDMIVQAIHAGLECGLLTEKVGDIDMISLGPDMFDVHTPVERLSISSTERVYNFLLEVLKRIN